MLAISTIFLFLFLARNLLLLFFVAIFLFLFHSDTILLLFFFSLRSNYFCYFCFQPEVCFFVIMFVFTLMFALLFLFSGRSLLFLLGYFAIYVFTQMLAISAILLLCYF